MSRSLFVAALTLSAASPALAQNLLVAPPSRSVVATSDAAVSAALAEWNGLRRSDALPFSSYARFLVAHPGWPLEAQLRRNAERALRADSEDPNLVAAYFGRHAPSSAVAMLRYAEALEATGRREEARVAARQAWTMGALTPEDEGRLLARFPGLLTPADHDLRMDRLLWSRSTTTAQRQIALASPSRQPLYSARLALQTRSGDAGSSASYAASAGARDAGAIADRVQWLRATGQEQSAQFLLAAPRQLAAPPLEPGRWMELLLGVARNAQAQNNHRVAFDIARQVDDTFPPGTDVSRRSFDERDDYTSLTWLAGWTAYSRLARPADAMVQFERYANAARSPQTRSKGLYWAGRAAQAAGRADLATGYWTRAATEFDQFHGQLAAERLGRAPALPVTTRTLSISAVQRDAFMRQEIVRATQLTAYDHQTQTLFVRQISQAIETDVEHALAAELATRIARPDLGVMVGRSAGINGHRDYIRAGFPVLSLPPEAQSNWTMVHAIARQESQFDRQATSRVGARGLMQLMPGTAREVAGQIGGDASAEGLYQPLNNIRMGSWYFARLMDRYGGSTPLAVAAYNAGAGNVNKWLRANGDPRTGSVDWLTWIEAIPFTETRGYVQRVLENAVVYDLLEPSRARVRSTTPLSAYIGKRTPG